MNSPSNHYYESNFQWNLPKTHQMYSVGKVMQISETKSSPVFSKRFPQKVYWVRTAKMSCLDLAMTWNEMKWQLHFKLVQTFFSCRIFFASDGACCFFGQQILHELKFCELFSSCMMSLSISSLILDLTYLIFSPFIAPIFLSDIFLTMLYFIRNWNLVLSFSISFLFVLIL